MNGKVLVWLGLLAVAFTGALVLIRDEDKSDGAAAGLPQPSTRQEKSATRVALDFVARLRDADLEGACNLMTAEAGRVFRCAGEPRMPSDGYRSIADSVKSEVYALSGVRHGGVATPVIRIENASGKARALAIEVDAAGRVIAIDFIGYA